MIETGEALFPADIERIAELHMSSIEESIPTMIGGRCAVRVFRYLGGSEREWVFVERIDGRVESCCVVSFEPASLNRRLLLATLPGLAWDALVALLSRPTFRRYLCHRLMEVLRGRSKEASGPEITYVFTNGELRGRGIGQRLVERVETFFRDQGIETYYVRTIDAENNRALAFYDRNGFGRIGRREEGGRAFVEFERHLVTD